MTDTDAVNDPRFIRSPGVPEHTRGGIVRYVDHGIPPGSFLSAVICNDLRGAFSQADVENREHLFEIVRWFWNEAPSSCWGSRGALETWCARLAQDRADV